VFKMAEEAVVKKGDFSSKKNIFLNRFFVGKHGFVLAKH